MKENLSILLNNTSLQLENKIIIKTSLTTKSTPQPSTQI